jgi:hypothetical protein
MLTASCQALLGGITCRQVQPTRKSQEAVMRELRRCAIAVHPAGGGERLIKYLYDVTSVKLVKRYELMAEQAGSVDPDNQNEYWLLKLGVSQPLSVAVSAGGVRRFRFRLTGASDLLTAKNWNDLPERYASYMKKNDVAI